jgi:Tol biopolymer transport system component
MALSRRSRIGFALLAVIALGAGVALWRANRHAPLPPETRGLLVYVSDYDGADALYARRLPDGRERPLARTLEPAREPALSPDGTRVAFSMGGRIALADVRTGDVRVLTLGVKHRDAAPAWMPDGRALVITARAPAERNADLQMIDIPETLERLVERRALTLTAGLDEREPAVAPDGSCVVFVRQDSLVRLDLGDGRTRRLTGGLRRVHHPVFRRDGRLLYLWQEGKQFGLDVSSADGKERETLSTGTARYRTLAPSPDGRFLMATFTYDLGFDPIEALKLRQTEELHLLDQRGRPLLVFLRSRRHAYHSPAWGS